METKLVVALLVIVSCTICTVSAGIGPQCIMPMDRGPCRAMVIKYAFNPETNRCEEFLYGGCEGNANRFNSLSSCKQVCA